MEEEWGKDPELWVLLRKVDVSDGAGAASAPQKPAKREEGRASQEQCGFRRRKPIQVAVREIKKGSIEKMSFELSLEVWADRVRCTPNKGNCTGRD